MNELLKQIAFTIPRSEWLALQREAARLNVSMTALIRQWIAPHVAKLTKAPKGDEE